MYHTVTYHLEPRGPMHVGESGVGLEQARDTVPSDTLYAALLANWVNLGEEGEAWDRAFRHSPPFLLTSAYPRVGSVRFYPVPQCVASETLSTELDVKAWKRVRFVSEAIFQRMVTGQSLEGWYPSAQAQAARGALLQGGALWLARDEIDGLPESFQSIAGPMGDALPRSLGALPHLKAWAYACTPRVAVDRLSQVSDIYHAGRVTWAPGCGLWFRVAYAEGAAAWRADLERALHALGDAGLGGMRSAGMGGFDWRSAQEGTLPVPDADALVTTLSRYHPRSAEAQAVLVDAQARYRLVAVAGYVGSLARAAQRRRRVWLVEAGSVLRATGADAMGDVVDVRPAGGFPHPVSRYGLAFPVILGGWDAS